MFNHIVLFKLKEANEANIEFVATTLKAMEGKIPELKGLEVGGDELRTDRSFDIALITRFESLEGMNNYQVHPYHVNEVLGKIKPYIDSSKVVDYNS
ncbi:MAG: Dabb family protein [Clostridium sp.]|uniref:Dabb family protein n=1 Tax=Clostridium sp. TaxID=1506 RepID=UPI0030376096